MLILMMMFQVVVQLPTKICSNCNKNYNTFKICSTFSSGEQKSGIVFNTVHNLSIVFGPMLNSFISETGLYLPLVATLLAKWDLYTAYALIWYVLQIQDTQPHHHVQQKQLILYSGSEISYREGGSCCFTVFKVINLHFVQGVAHPYLFIVIFPNCDVSPVDLVIINFTKFIITKSMRIPQRHVFSTLCSSRNSRMAAFMCHG